MGESFFTFDDRLHPICEIGLSATRQAEPTTWLDVSCYVHEAELFRGRERFNERFEPGTASVTFSNANGWADLGGTYTEVAEAELRPGRPIRIGVRGPWDGGPVVTRWLYRGYIDQATPAYDPTLHDVVTVNCIDALGEAGSSTAPAGAHQGVNETVSARLNRVLDAVGWWSGKRKIAATATTVQGTELGGGAIDHMSQAADSAGGVVFGDLDGDVVFKDIDWMLYDPDTPPDDGIGNGPGTGGPGAPPYIDPTAGPVYDPDDPPSSSPPKVCICADGTTGTLIEKGDNYRLYVKDGHLLYETSGHTWDLGPYSGGCTCVEPGDSPDDAPERTNDPDEDGTYEPDEYVPEEILNVFAVELLGYSDSGLADPTWGTITISGITPGVDCLLVVLATGIGGLTDTDGLAPTVTGGDLDWSHSRGIDRPGGIASTHIILTQVGRDDPGTFDVAVSWTPPSISRSHIITVWKVVAAVDDYVARFDAGDVAHGLATSAPPEFLQPGDGPVTVTLATYNAPAIPAAARFVDITIAQSLAEEGTEPFGALFDDADGLWNTPTFIDAAPVLLVGEAEPFCDDFERPDGDIGPEWQVGLYSSSAGPTNETRQLFTIDTGAAVGPSHVGAGIPRNVATMLLATPTGGDTQSIEVTLENVTPTAGSPTISWSAYYELYNFADPWPANTAHVGRIFIDHFAGASFPSLFVSARRYETGCIYVDGSGGSDSMLVPGQPFTIRFDSDRTTGLYQIFVNDALVDEGALGVSATLGDFQGVLHTWKDPVIGTAPRMLETCMSGGGIVRKASWVAGWRWGSTASTVKFADVNLGPSNLQSAQACLVLESAEVPSGSPKAPKASGSAASTTRGTGSSTRPPPASAGSRCGSSPKWSGSARPAPSSTRPPVPTRCVRRAGTRTSTVPRCRPR